VVKSRLNRPLTLAEKVNLPLSLLFHFRLSTS
jgi:hypothetical protein